MPYALYYATTPPPKRIEPEVLQRLVWLIEGPDVRLGAA